ncbi:helix-turn-helix domain-containing protein [Gordonia sp. SID5947]|uniref:GlxA family transcriptional regulator n=1 Tax=Gordonia sp. SID5947 TaxID=2690315 RepID=UPI00136A7CDC|nr:helix-turn-helix domain-containing protein [Gordonia sp. SID5947]MYR05482.1 helix-turn-helix domain-containing protein [Gordonia sp. SID5947]
MRVAIYMFDGVSLFHVAAPQLVFQEAAQLSGDPSAWSITLWSTTAGEVRLAEGHRFSGLAGPEATVDADIVVIPSWPKSAPPVSDALRRHVTSAHDRGATIAGLCLGALAVADTGLLRGRPAVTHWAAAELLTARGGNLADNSVLYIDHGDVITSAGTVSSIDACLHLVRERCGADLANRVARRMVVAPHREGGQAQYIEQPLSAPASSTTISAVLDWALEHLDGELSVEALAERGRMSKRSFIRQFRNATGTTPARWVLRQRLERARTLLETTDWDLRLVAHSSGFNSEVTFRQNFTAQYAVTPSSYRRQFRHADRDV